MVSSGNRSVSLEVDSMNSHALISWRSIAAGLLVAGFVMMGLIGLGLAFGGIGLDTETTAKSAGIFTGAWFIGSTLISLFVGSYFAARVSKFRMGRIGSAQGIVIATLFLGFIMLQVFGAIGTIGSVAGNVLGQSGSAIAEGAQRLAQSPNVRTAITNLSNRALGDLNLKSAPSDVAKGIGDRLIAGDVEGAQTYLARESGITPAEANARIAQAKVQIDQAVDEAKITTGNALKSAGWTLFLLVVLGGGFGALGGGLGSVANFRRPLIKSREDYLTGAHQPV